MKFTDRETRFSVLRWVATVLPVWLALTDYFTLQAYLLRLHDDRSADSIRAGWDAWYLTIMISVLLAISLNLLLNRFKRIFGTETALKAAVPFLILYPNFIFFSRNTSFVTGNSTDKFLYFQLFIVLAITLVFHAVLFFYKDFSRSRKLL